MDYPALKALIDADPALAELAKAGRDADIVIALSAKTEPGPVPIEEINALADTIGLSAMLRMLDRKSDDALMTKFGVDQDTVDVLRVLIFAALGLFDARYASVDFGDAEKSEAFAQVAGGLRKFQIIKSDEDYGRFLALGQNRAPRAVVTVNDVSFALRGDR